MQPINITNKYLTAPEWLDQERCGFSFYEGTHVWHISVSENLPQLPYYLKLLKPDEIERANRFHRQKDRDRFVISRAVLKQLIGKYLILPAEAIEFVSGKNKKPFIKNDTGGQGLHYNMSHSNDAIVLAVQGGYAVGVDVEFINNDFGYAEVLTDNFSRAEIAYIAETDAVNRFFKLWTRKEAITKATAQGLDCDLRLLPALDGMFTVQPGIIASDENWQISSFTIAGAYAVSIANNQPDDKMSFFKHQPGF